MIRKNEFNIMPVNSHFHGLELFGQELRFDAPGQGPGFPGAAWRGLLGQALFDSVCPHPAPVCASCPSAGGCPYPSLFKPLADAALTPFWLHGWQRRGRLWRVEIRWLGRDRHFAVGEWLAALARDDLNMTFGGAPVKLSPPSATSPIERRPLVAQAPPTRRCRVRFLTPLVSKHHGDPLFGALRTRIQRLVQQHGDGTTLSNPKRPWQCRVLGERARRIPLARRVLTGTLWELELQDIDPDAWALLCAGVELHAGGQTGLGCGHYELLAPHDQEGPSA